MIIGYARTSTLDQKYGLEAQQEILVASGTERVFSEQVSSVARRVELEAALDFVRAGDTLVVTKMDRLARSVRHLWEIVDRLDRKGVALRIIDLGIDTKSAVGKLILTMLSGIAQFERDLLLERQREGIAKAKNAGKYRGRKPTARAKEADAKRLRSEGFGAAAISRKLGIGRASVYRIWD